LVCETLTVPLLLLSVDEEEDEEESSEEEDEPVDCVFHGACACITSAEELHAGSKLHAMHK
jgi:hypothetical protein